MAIQSAAGCRTHAIKLCQSKSRRQRERARKKASTTGETPRRRCQHVPLDRDDASRKTISLCAGPPSSRSRYMSNRGGDERTRQKVPRDLRRRAADRTSLDLLSACGRGKSGSDRHRGLAFHIGYKDLPACGTTAARARNATASRASSPSACIDGLRERDKEHRRAGGRLKPGNFACPRCRRCVGAEFTAIEASVIDRSWRLKEKRLANAAFTTATFSDV